MGTVAPSPHHNGRTRSAPIPRTENVSQNIFRSMHPSLRPFRLPDPCQCPQRFLAADRSLRLVLRSRRLCRITRRRSARLTHQASIRVRYPAGDVRPVTYPLTLHKAQTGTGIRSRRRVLYWFLRQPRRVVKPQA